MNTNSRRQKVGIRTLVVVILAFLVRASSAQENLVMNPGFEDLDSEGKAVPWNLPKEVYAVDTRVARSGRKSLRVHNSNKDVYLLATQSIPFEPGRFYRMSIWVKTENVAGNEMGATMCMEWSNEKEWLGGSYPAGIKGTRDWTLLEADSSIVPEQAKSVQFVLYLRKGMTGTAWFDDACVVARYPPPLTTFMVSPTYRGYLLPQTKPQPVRIRATVGKPLPEDRKLEEVELRVNERPFTVDAEKREVLVEINPATLKPGQNSITLSLQNVKTQEELARQVYTVKKWTSEEPLPEVYVDSHRRVIVGNKPFFPLGLYFSAGPRGEQSHKDLDILASSPFNCLMNYGVTGGSLEDIRKYLDAIHERRLKIIFSIKDVYEGTQYYPKQVDRFKGEQEIVEGLVNTFKKHPALLAWYINDELPLSFIPRLEKRQQDIVRLDPDHPTWVVLYQINELKQYLNTTDVLGTDPYPIPYSPISNVTTYMRKTYEAVEGNRAIWMVPQVMNWSVYRQDEKPVRGPTYEEMRNMTFQCIVGGATGLVYYSFFDLKRDPYGFDKRWPDVCRVGEEVKSLVPYLLSTETAPSISLKEPNESILFATRQCKGKKLLMAVNISSEEQKVAFVFPKKPRNVRRTDGAHAVSLKGKELTATFVPIGVHFYEWQ